MGGGVDAAAVIPNGGKSLTGLEAISNGVSAFRKPEGVNARRVLVIMALSWDFWSRGCPGWPIRPMPARIKAATPR